MELRLLKILILKPSSLGDVIQAMPVLRLLKLHHPNSEIFWWINSNLAPLLANDPDLKGIFSFHRRRWSSLFNWNELLASIRQMRRKNFDLVIDLQGLARSGSFAWLANGGLTIGLDDAREGARGFYDVAIPRPSSHTHAVDWYLQVLKFLDVPVHHNFQWLAPHLESQRKVEEIAGRDVRWIAINPGARWLNKRWPAEYFSELVGRLAVQNKNSRFVILGGKDDQPLGQIISRSHQNSCLDLTGKTSLLEMIEWIRRSEFIVTNDTGPMHVAAALKKPVIALFGPTAPQRTGPYGQLEKTVRIPLPCSPCLKNFCSYPKPLECLRAITPQFVHDEIQRRPEISTRFE
ncbi:MAG: lipopolysaccharide heptosyltransferase II [Verrucomicrobiota bacterium]